jgi:spore coat protein A, manganese oxidase
MFRSRMLYSGFILLLIVGLGLTCGAQASVQIPGQIPLPGSSVTKWLDPLPVFGPGAGPGPTQREPAGSALTVYYQEFQQKVLPNSFYTGLTPFNLPDGRTIDPSIGTYVWGYKVGTKTQLYPGFSVEAQQGTPTTVTYINNLGTSTAPYPILQKYITVDQTLMWANPLGAATTDPNPYNGPQPVVAHLHGGEVRSDSDGGPDEWWTPGGEGYLSTPPAPGGIRGPGFFKNVYSYPNTQEGTTLWFHDHALGATRTNVYAGLAAFYLLRDNFDTGLANNPLNLPAMAEEIEIAIQDRQFDTTGQWFWPDGVPAGAGLNGDPPNTSPIPPGHPYWIPEFFGDVIVVNGKSWPYLQVEPRRYRFRLLNGSNARVYEMRLWNQAALPNPTPGPPIYVIGTDGGLKNVPAMTASSDTNRLIIAPGERYDLIIDFTNFANQTLTVMNYAGWPFPNGNPIVSTDPFAELMQFRVAATATSPDNTYEPASGNALRGGINQPPPNVQLVNPSTGTPAVGVNVNKKRQLILREVAGPGGPLEVLVNNTKFNGLRAGTATPIPDSYKVGANWLTELPQIGSTEQWEIINMTVDAHPIHLHMIQFQLMNRQAYDDVAYSATYDAAFPGLVAIDGYGPPGNYNQPNGDLAIGGNPAVSPFLGANPIKPPLRQERGWKDTVIAYPGEVTRIMARWAPTGVPLNGVRPGQNLFAFNPTYGPGYVWHCHIIDHEDNEMMRPYIPTKNANNSFARFGAENTALQLLLLLTP